jgi:signal peptidase I
MRPTLSPGDRLLAARRSRIRFGDIVAFPEPSGSGRWYVKRVVGVGGDEVTVEGDALAVNEVALRVVHSEPRPRRWLVADDELFVLSDDTMTTRADSRVFGPIERAQALVVLARYAPRPRLRLRA